MSESTESAATLASNGHMLLREYHPSMSSVCAFERLGVIDTVEGLNPVQHLIPKDLSEAPPNTYSGNFGTSDFPLHTDLAHWARPPRYLALRCLQGSPDVATRLYDGNLLIAEFGIEALRMALVQPRRPMRNGKQLLRLVERVDGSDSLRIRWDSLYLCPATPVTCELFNRIQAFLAQVKPVEVVLLRQGDTLLVDNWRMLHGRSPASRDACSRRIDRAYMRSTV